MFMFEPSRSGARGFLNSTPCDGFRANRPVQTPELPVRQVLERAIVHRVLLSSLRVRVSVQDLTLITVLLRLIRQGDEWVIPTLLRTLTPAEAKEFQRLIKVEKLTRGLE